ncbi:Imm12 family immunity protein [Paenibacillus sp. GYB004]|uniref:Imm12 family immunity protein n=1 Tax=Paenibacillus sp. GYB004 TaxID=2994393 RepID=UPI002F9694BB
MELTIRTIYGGAERVTPGVVQSVRDLRQRIKASMQDAVFSCLQEMDVCLCFNGDVSTYYDKSGIYQPLFYKTKQKFITTICLDASEWSGDPEEDTSTFHTLFRDYLLEAGAIVETKASKNKLEFERPLFERCIRNAFGDSSSLD